MSIPPLWVFIIGLPANQSGDKNIFLNWRPLFDLISYEPMYRFVHLPSLSSGYRKHPY